MVTEDEKEERVTGAGDEDPTDGDAVDGDSVKGRPRVIEFQGSQKEFFQSLRPGDKLIVEKRSDKRR